MSLLILSIVFVSFGQLLNAVIVLVDKYVVTQTAISRPITYAFFVGALSATATLLLPFGVIHAPSLSTVWLSLAIGVTFIVSLIFLFSALRIAQATDVIMWLAVISTITTFILDLFLLNENLPKFFPYALALLILGLLLVGHFRFNSKSFFFVLVAGILFGFSTVLLKILFADSSFLDGFFWSRMGNVAVALPILLIPQFRRSILESSRQSSHRTSLLVVFNRILGGIAFLSILYAIRIGPVSIVNALASLQFVFLFLLVFLFRKKMPNLFAHEFRPGHVAHKIFAVLFIVAGFFVLFI